MVVLRGEEEISLKGTAGTPVIMVEKITDVEGLSDAQRKLREKVDERLGIEQFYIFVKAPPF